MTHTSMCVCLSRTSISLFLLLANYSTVLVDATSMPKLLCVTNVTGPLLACLYIFYKRMTLKEAEVWKKIFLKQKLLSRFWNKVCRLLSSAVLLRNVSVNSKLQHPPGQPPGHLTFLKIIVQIPPSLGSIRSFFMCHATYKAFFKKIPPIEITTSWQIHWHASSLTLLINIQAAGQSNWPLLSFIIVLNRRDRYCNSL